MTTLPPPIHEALQQRFGMPTEITPLSGLSQSAVWRVHCDAECLVLKKSVEPKELNFYRDIAPQLVTQGVPIPAVKWSETLPDAFWFAIEYISDPLPRERWLADPQAMTVLYRLHHSALDLAPETDWLFRPRWDDAMIEAALSFFSSQIAASLRPRLEAIQHASQLLFEPRVWISGDPNPRNWGVRQDSSAVLFDWERFGRGTPPLDIAITMPGFPSSADFPTVAACYLQNDTVSAQSDVETFTCHLARAKVWNIVEFLAMAQTHPLADPSIISRLTETVPTWLESLKPLLQFF